MKYFFILRPLIFISLALQASGVTQVFEYDFDFDGQGIVHYLATADGETSYENPHLTDRLDVTSSTPETDSLPPFAVVGNETVRFVSTVDANAWVKLDFKGLRILPTHYSLRHYSSWDTEALRNWVLEASNDNTSWIVLREHVDDDALYGKGDTATWKIPLTKVAYRYFRIRLTGPNSNNHYYLALSGFEIYGELDASNSPPLFDPFPYTHSHSYVSDFDGHGIVAYLATEGDLTPYRNPALLGYLAVEVSSTANDAAPKETIVALKPDAYFSNPDPNSWVTIDFKERRVKPTHYSLRHYNRWDTEALRNWVLEGSNNQEEWVVLSTHNNDPALYGKGDTHTWSIPQNSNVVPLRYFRIRQTGKNSNNHYYLPLAGFEIYGTRLSQEEDVFFSSHSAELVHTTNFDEHGLVGYLATTGGRTPYTNPALTGLLSVNASSLENDSETVQAIVGNATVRCVTSAETDAWMSINFKNVNIQPTHYSLRHYSSWDTEALRNWVLEASNDGQLWFTISTHINDSELNGIGDVHTWAIPQSDNLVPFSQFRIRQTGPNSNNHYFLALSGFEIYGAVEREGLLDLMEASQEEKNFEYSSDFDGNGIVYFMATNGLPDYTNPEQTGRILTSASSLAADSQPSSVILGTQAVRCTTLPITNSWMGVEFTTHNVLPTTYTLRHYSSWDTEALRNWVLEASNNGTNWTVLSEHSNDTALNGKGDTHTWTIPTAAQPRPYSHFRIRQTGPNSNNHHYLALSGLELYGTLYPKYTLPPLPEESDYDTIALSSEGPDLIDFIGTAGHTKTYENPIEAGLMDMRASSFMNDSENPEAILNRDLIRFTTKPLPDSWVQADFKNRRVRPSHYGLQHYKSWDTEALRNWVLEGSNDGLLWDILKTHINDTALQTKGQWHTWPIDPIASATGYSQLRIRQTGPNSNNHYYLALSGLRVFGTLHAPENHPVLTPGNTPQEFEYVSDFDENGIVYHLATSGGNYPYENPAEAGLISATASALMPDSEAASAIVGNATVRCVTRPVTNSWMQVDFQSYEIRPTHYTLRHYSSWPTEALRNWVLEASTDGTDWAIIRNHKEDITLFGIGATYTWPLSGVGPEDWYTHFRIRQTGPNSSGKLYLALSGFELYGTLAVRDERRNASLRIDLSPSSAIDAGAQWSIDGGTTWYTDGTELTRLFSGSYTGMVTTVAHYWPPTNLVMDIASNQLNVRSLVYTAMNNHTDTDFDGIPDLWESQQELDPANNADALQDPDGDGQVTLFEYHAGTKFYDGNSYMKVWLNTEKGESRLLIQPGENMDPFVAETCADLKTWNKFDISNDELQDDTRILTDSAAMTSNAFYRIRLK